MALSLDFADTTTQNRAYSVFWLSKRPKKWPFRWFSRTLRHEIGLTACSGCLSVRGNGRSVGFLRTLRHGIGATAYSGGRSVRRNGHFIGFSGHYDTKSGLQHVLAVQASGEMAIPLVFADVTTRNRPYSVFWLSKRPRKWPAPLFLRTLRHEIGPTVCSGCPSVRGNGPSAGFCGRYDTKSALQHVLVVEASGEMAIPLFFPDTTTRNRPYSVFWLSKRPGKWPFHRFFRTLRHEIGATACSGCPSVRGNGHFIGFSGRYDTNSGLQHVLAV